MTKEKKTIKVTERGWAGHFVAAGGCRFRRNTLIESGRKKIVVSTVGLYYPSYATKGPEIIGFDRYYETMAFKAQKEGAYWEADVTKQLDFESNWALDYFNDSSDNDANEMHDTVVAEFVEKLSQ